jgi:hypothetical protein
MNIKQSGGWIKNFQFKLLDSSSTQKRDEKSIDTAFISHFLCIELLISVLKLFFPILFDFIIAGYVLFNFSSSFLPLTLYFHFVTLFHLQSFFAYFTSARFS